MKLYHIIQGDCFSCVKQIDDFYLYFRDSSFNDQIIQVFIVSTTNFEFFINYYYPKLTSSPTLIIDESFEFIRINNLPLNEKYNTFLTNQSNKIILIGNPLSNKTLKKLYPETIKNLQ